MVSAHTHTLVGVSMSIRHYDRQTSVGGVGRVAKTREAWYIS